jgi:hypothetical protein
MLRPEGPCPSRGRQLGSRREHPPQPPYSHPCPPAAPPWQAARRGHRRARSAGNGGGPCREGRAGGESGQVHSPPGAYREAPASVRAVPRLPATPSGRAHARRTRSGWSAPWRLTRRTRSPSLCATLCPPSTVLVDTRGEAAPLRRLRRRLARVSSRLGLLASPAETGQVDHAIVELRSGLKRADTLSTYGTDGIRLCIEIITQAHSRGDRK